MIKNTRERKKNFFFLKRNSKFKTKQAKSTFDLRNQNAANCDLVFFFLATVRLQY